MLVINPKLIPAKTFAEFVAYLKANPGKVSFATPGNGTIAHMWGAQFLKSTGTQMTHIPYRVQARPSTTCSAARCPCTSIRWRPLCPTSSRARSWPWPCPGMSALKCCPMCRPMPRPATPTSTIHPGSDWSPQEHASRTSGTCAKAIIAALKDPAVKQRMAAQGLYPSGTSSADFTKQIASEVAKMKKVAASANIHMD